MATYTSITSLLQRFFRHRFAWLIALTFFIILLYAQIFSFSYTFLDDNRLIKENFWLISSPALILQIFTEDIFLYAGAAYYRPLFTLSFMPDAILAQSPDNLQPFFATNILLHLANIALIALLLRKLSYSKSIIIITTVLFAVHPMHTQLVAWIPGRNDTLFSLFTLSSILCWLKFLDHKKMPWLAAHFCVLFLALLSKEAAVLIPAVIVLFTLLWKQMRLSFMQWWLVGMGWLASAQIWFLLRSQVIMSGGANSPLSILESLWRNSPAALHYLGKMLFPYDLSVLSIVADGNTLLGSFAAFMLLGAAIFIWKKSKNPHRVLFALAWFALFLLPGIAVHNPAVNWGQDIQLDHRAYVPLIGLVLILAEGLKTIGTRNSKPAFVVVGIVAAVFSSLTFFHSRHFSDKFAFWTQAVATSPHSPLAHRNLAAMYQLEGDLEQAESLYLRALSLNPNEPMAQGNLGVIYENQEKNELAEKFYRKEIAVNPNFSLVYANLARLLAKQNKLEEARELWLESWQLEPQNSAPLIAYAQSFQDDDPSKYEQLKNDLIKKGVPESAFEGSQGN